MNINVHELRICTECNYQFEFGSASLRVAGDGDGNTVHISSCPSCLSPKHEKLNEKRP
jgi:hypothetical protein